MIQNNRYCKAKQAAVNADATRSASAAISEIRPGTSAATHTT